MSHTMTLAAEEVIPTRGAVFDNQGIPPRANVSAETETIYGRALGMFAALAEPRVILSEVSKSEFAVIYDGERRNEPRTPVGDIFPRADALALFVVTIGAAVSREIDERFRTNDFAFGSMLDSVASSAADKAADVVQGRFLGMLAGQGRVSPTTGVLRYSPGYCGWHMSGQKKLFEFLEPERIGVLLRESCLMEPLKTVSGVLIAGSREIHDFEDTYEFCNRCEAHGCRERIRTLLARQGNADRQGGSAWRC